MPTEQDLNTTNRNTHTHTHTHKKGIPVIHLMGGQGMRLISNGL